MNIAPSIKSLSSNNIRLDCKPELIRALWKTPRDKEQGLLPLCERLGITDIYRDFLNRTRGYYRNPSTREIRRELINTLAGFHGIECLGQLKISGERVYYCNAGDPYAPTLVFIGNRLIVSCWSHYVENKLIYPCD